MFNQLIDKAGCHIELALIFGQIAFFVGQIEQQPLLRSEAQRMFQALEYQIAVFAAIAMSPQGGQRGRMRGIVGKVEAAFQ